MRKKVVRTAYRGSRIFGLDARVVIFIVFAAYVAQPHAMQKDTIIIGNGGPGPYALGSMFIDTATLRITAADSAISQVPAFVYIGKANAVLFASAIDSGARLRARFSTKLYGLPKTYALFDKAYALSRDTAMAGSDTLPQPRVANAFAEENLVVSGYKSINVSVNSMGSMNLEQALDVNLSGEIAPKTILSGHLTDQGSSLEGSTREIADLDMVYVSLDNPRYSALIGDQYVNWPVTGMLSGKKKIKGLSAGLTLPSVSVKAFGALSAGKFAVQTITGKAGLQGPYRLVGGGEEGFIMPISGTVRASIGDRQLREGLDQDFTVDYDLGALSFTPRILIKNEDIIRVEYEYRLFDYQRTFSGASVSAATRDSVLSARGGFWYETDNKNQPLDIALTPADISRLSQAGDSTAGVYGGRLIDPKDVAWQSAQVPLYRDSAGMYVFKPFDPQRPADNQGFYYVTFRSVGAGKGDYDIDSASMKSRPGLGPIYSYVGKGRGSAALPLIPLPQSTTTGEMQVKLTLPLLNVSADIAAMNHDPNLFSNRGNIDKNGAAADLSAVIGSKRTDKKSMWAGAGYGHITPDMNQEVSSAFDRDRLWDDTTGATRTGLRQTWEAFTGATIMPNTFAEGSYGQYLHDGSKTTDRFTGSARAQIVKPLSLDYHGDYFRHFSDSGIDNTRRGEAHGTYTALIGEAQLVYRDEWRVQAAGQNRGLAGAGVNLSAAALGLKESLQYTGFLAGPGGMLSARDTGYSIQWDQECAKTFSTAWSGSLASHYLLRDIFTGDRQTSVLVIARNDFSVPAKGFSSNQTYQVTIEQASAMVQIPVPVGKGLGDHAWNDTLKEYVPAKNGDYIIQEQEIYGAATDNRVRKAQLNLSWSLSRPSKRKGGIVSDLGWSGSLSVDEQLNTDRALSGFSWLPGYTSLWSASLLDSAIRFADMYYRQNMDWIPDSLLHLRGQAYVQPFLKKIRDYSETGLQWGGSMERTLRRWSLTLETDLLSVNRKAAISSSLDNFNIADRHGQIVEKCAFYRDFSAYCKQAVGWASKSSDSSCRGWYYRLIPGLMWQPGAKGSADLSYTYSAVDIPGILDYRMAQGFASGVSHTIDMTAHINFGAHFMTDLNYRSQFGVNVSARGSLHTVSMQMKALL